MNILGKSFYITSGIALTIIGSLAAWQSVKMYESPVKKANFEVLRSATANACYNKAAENGLQTRY